MKTIKVQLHLVATEEDSHLGLSASGAFDLTYFKELREEDDDTVLFNLYFTSDEEIKEGDYFYNTHNKYLAKATNRFQQDGYARKIVASTDPKLTMAEKDSWKDRKDILYPNKLPQPTKQLIEAYCKKPFDECLIEMELMEDNDGVCNYNDKLNNCLCGREKDTPECFANYFVKIKVNSYNEITCHPVVENMYNREEVEKLFEQYHEFTRVPLDGCLLSNLLNK